MATSPTANSKKERVQARVTAEQKILFERAAALRGRSLTDFLVDSAQAAAEETIRAHEVITLSARDSLAFAQALLNPPEPNEALRRAFKRHAHEIDSCLLRSSLVASI